MGLFPTPIVTTHLIKTYERMKPCCERSWTFGLQVYMPIGNGFETKSHKVNEDVDILLVE
jgi:hypothetical protein